MSEMSYTTDTRFGAAADFVKKIEGICGKPVIHTIAQAEPIGPKALLDILVVAPCTGNTLGKIALGITDSCVAMAAKAHLRNQRPLVLAISTNDALSGSAANLGKLLVKRGVYFVPFGQDDPFKKPSSMVADMEKISPAVALALTGSQLQPLVIGSM